MSQERSIELGVSARRRKSNINRRVLLKGATAIGTGLATIQVAQTGVAAESTVHFVEAAHLHQVHFPKDEDDPDNAENNERRQDDNDLSRIKSRVDTHILPEHYIDQVGDNLVFTQDSDAESREFVRNSERVVKMPFGDYEHFPESNIGPDQIPSLETGLAGRYRPVGGFEPSEQYSPPNIQIQNEGTGININAKGSEYHVPNKEARQIRLASQSVRLHLRTESGETRKEPLEVTQSVSIRNHGEISVKN